jgi:hypothetical protein
MTTNARIERLTREALGNPGYSKFRPPVWIYAVAAALVIGACAMGAALSLEIGGASPSHSFVGTEPASTAHGNVRDLTY